MRSFMIGAMGMLAVATPAQAERFAISCKGQRVIAIGMGDRVTPTSSTSAKAVYLIDEEAQTVDLELKDGKRVTVCGSIAGMVCEKHFSATEITFTGALTTDDRASTSTFSWDRAKGQVRTRYISALPNGAGAIVEEQFKKCVRVPMPEAAQ